MPVYQYQGQHFDLPDGLSNEDAIGKIKKHLGQGTDTPKENPFMDVAPAAVSMVAGLPSQIWGGLRGLHDLASGKGLDAAANRVKHEQESNFGFGEFKAPTEEGQRYIDKLQETMAMPGQLAGRGAEKLGLDPIYGQLPVDAAMNFIAPAHIAAGAGGMLKRAVGKAPEAPRAPVDVSVLKEPEAAPAARIPEQMELPLETTAQQIAERRGAEVGQRDMFGPVNEELGRPDMGQPIGPKPVPEPIDAMRQHELFDQPSQGRVANPYEAVTGDWRIDENGMPIKADLSMDVANAADPLQRNLWGDELPRKHQQEALPLTEAIDSMPNPPWESPRSQGIDMLTGKVDATADLVVAKMEADGWIIPKSQRGALNMDVFSPAFEKVKELADGIRLVMKGRPEGPVVIAVDKTGKKVGEVGFSHDTWARPPRATDNLEAGWVTTDPTKMSGGLDADRMAPTIKSEHKGLATEMYKFAAENGNDIIASGAQTPEGRKMWEGFEKRGVSKGMKIPKGQRGGFDFNILPKSFRDFLENWHQAGGNFSHVGVSRMLDDHPVKLTSEQRKTLAALYPEVANTYQKKIDAAWENSDQAKAARMGKRYDDALIAESVVKQFDAFNTGFKLDGPRYDSKTGPYAGRVAAQEGADAAINRARGPKGQRGAVDLKAIEDGIKRMAGQVSSATSKTLPLVAKAPIANSMETPTLPATIIKKNELRTKTEASALLKKLAPEYASVTTKEEALFLAKDAKDINYNPVRDATISGINGLTMLKRDNPVLNYARYMLQEYRNIKTKFSKDYITSPDGVATTYSKLKGEDRVQAVEVLREAAAAQLEITAQNIKKLGLKPAQEAYILSVRKMLDAQWDMAADSLQMAGRNAFEKRAGYLPSMFTGSYKSLVGSMQDGVFVTKHIVQADTKLGHNAALKAYLKDNPGSAVKELPRQGLKQMGRSSNLFNGFNDIMNVIAKHDPRFAELQMAAQMKINEANHSLMNFDVHEMHKKGISGAVGDNPYLSKQQNADQLGRAIIDFGEQGADYYAAQKALNNIGEVLTSPDVGHMPNTIATVADHLKHVTGQNLNPLGNALNWGIDGLFKAIGVSPKVPLAAARGFKTAMGIHMMGIYNPTFTALQLTQVITGAFPETLKVGSKLGVDITTSATTAPLALSMLKYGKAVGVDVPVAAHMKAAFQYAQDHGIMDFSELEIAHKATRNKNINRVEAVGAFPISLGEKLTRPPVFMTFADMFHKFGLADSEAFMAAQHATNMAMGDYHPNERPKIYQALGLVGEFGGALTTFKHNAITNLALRGKDAVYKDSGGKRMITPALAAIAAASLFQGISGMPGFDELDAMYQWATNQMGKRQGITETALKQVPDWGKYGYLSSSSGLDFHSRMSMSRALPEMSGAALSPQLAALADIGLKAYAYGKFKDEQSYKDFIRSITPSGLKGAMEDKMLTDDKGFVSNPAGELMNEQPRNANERMWRKFAAVKPLRESVEQKDVYIDAKSIKEREEAQKALSQRFRQAFAAGDQKGMDSLAQMYYDKEGDPSVLWNDTALQNQIIRSNQSQRDRMTGQLQATMKSINRYRDMNDGN